MGVDLKEIRISSVPETAKNLGFKKKKRKKMLQKLVLSSCRGTNSRTLFLSFRGISERGALAV